MLSAVLGLVNVVIWRDVNFGHYQNQTIDTLVEYKQYDIGSNPPRILKPKFYNAMYTLSMKVLAFCKRVNKIVWVSGGTLLGLCRHRELMRFDDDIDLHTPVSNKEFFFSKQCSRIASEFGLKVFVLRGTSTTHASREGAAVRFHLNSDKVPTLDMFFVKITADTVQKIDSWADDKYKVSSKEKWDRRDIFPLQTITVRDKYTFPIPNQPVRVLTAQYGDSVMTQIRGRSEWFSHRYVFTMLPYMWRYL